MASQVIPAGFIAYAAARIGASSRASLAGRSGVVLRVEFDADVSAAGEKRRFTRRTRTGERIEHDATRRAERLYERLQGADGLLSGVDGVARVRELDDVGRRLVGQFRLAFGQQVSVLVAIGQEPRRRTVGLDRASWPYRGQLAARLRPNPRRL